jgi:DNA-binding NtrC family response regulator/tetratricopeptide (TPR) repeat protein
MAELSSNYVGDPTLGVMCVGREAELAKLSTMYSRATTEGGHSILINGPSGVGKSRLLLEFKRRLRLDGVCVLEGRCRQDQSAYQPFLEIVRLASNYLADLAPALFQAARSMEIIEGLSGGGIPNGDLRFDRWEDRRIRLYDSVGELLSTVAQVRSPVVILHDVQFADEASLSLLSHLLNTLSGSPELRRQDTHNLFKGLFIVSERLNGSGATVGSRYLSSVSHAHLTLSGLDRAGVEAFLTSPEVVSRFVEASGGNPRHLEALLEPQDSDADALLLLRLKDLPAAARRIASALAVLGRPASPRTLGRLAGLVGTKLGPAMERLMRAEVLLSSIQDGDLKLSYKSTSDQEAVIGELKEEDLRQHHATIGRELLNQGDEICAAEHLLQGDSDGQHAAEVAAQAGERLEIAFAYDRAIDLYERAIALDQEIELRHELEERLCDLLELTGEYERAVALTERLAERSPGVPRLSRRIGHLHLQQGDFSQAQTKLSEALGLVAEDDPLEQAFILTDLAELSYLQGRHREAQETVDRVLNLEQMDTLVPFLKARNTLGKVLLEQGDFGGAAVIFRTNLEQSRAANVTPEEIRSLINLGISHLRQGRYEEAADCYRAGLSAAESSQDYRHRAFCLQNLGVLAHWRRDYTSALQLFHDAIQTFLKLGHKSWLSWLALDLGDLYLELGDVVRAETMLDLSTNLVNAKDDSQTPLFAQVLQGKLAAYYGRFADAEDFYRKAREEAEKAGKNDEAATAALELSRLMLATGNSLEAEAIASKLTDAPTLKTRADAQALVGQALGHEDRDLDGAARALDCARSLYEQAGDPFGLWSVLALIGDLYKRSGNARDATRAIEKAQSMEARIRKSVPPEFVDGYLAHPRRRLLLEQIGVVMASTSVQDLPHSPADRVVPAAADTVAASPASRRKGQTIGRSARQCERYSRIVGESEKLLRVFDLMDKIAPLESTVLVRGESGTGKELIAEAIHTNSPRRDKPIVKVNCGALVEGLLLSELFGHERGAFTGASRRKKGRFEVADGGTIFLDEIGDITPRTQVALLRVLQEKEFERVGGNTPIHVDVRIVCATNRNLERMVQDGSFREDLYYRLKAFQIEVPPLRARATDIVLLANTFLDQMVNDGECPRRTLGEEAGLQLGLHAWPGNVRELQNVLRSVSLLSEGMTIKPSDLQEFLPGMLLPVAPVERLPLAPSSPVEVSASAAPFDASVNDGLSESEDAYSELINEGLSLHEYKKKIEEECIARALRQTSGNITRAATLLKMKRPRLSQLVKEYGLTG